MSDKIQSLNEKTILLNAVLTRAEDFFRRENAEAGAPAEVAIEQGVGLAFKRHEGTWGFYIVRPIPVTPGQALANVNYTPLTKASRRLRILAAHNLERLYEALLESVDGAEGALEEATRVAEAFLESAGCGE